jgi:hypothetical protein
MTESESGQKARRDPLKVSQYDQVLLIIYAMEIRQPFPSPAVSGTIVSEHRTSGQRFQPQRRRPCTAKELSQ